MAREWVKTPIKASDELSKKRSAQLEEQTKRAKEEAARKYQEYLAAHPEEIKQPVSNNIETVKSNEPYTEFLTNMYSGIPLVPLTINKTQEQLNEEQARLAEERKTRQREYREQRSQKSNLIMPPVTASNERVLNAAQRQRERSYSAEHYAELLDIKLRNAKLEADLKAKEAIEEMSVNERKQFIADMTAIKVGNEQRMQKQTPKAIREHRMSPEAYARHVTKQTEKHKAPEYKARLQQQKKDRHITHGANTVRPLAPMPDIEGPLKPPYNSAYIPIKPPCSNPIKPPVSQNTAHTVQQKRQRQYKRIMLAKQEALPVKLDTLEVFKRLFVILAILQHFNITTIGDLVKWDMMSIRRYCKLYNTEFTTQDFFAIRKELKEKYDIIWRKPNGLKEEI